MASKGPLGLDPSILAWALAWDLTLGELPAEVHPDLFMERAAAGLESAAPQRTERARRLYGTAVAYLFPYAAWTIARWVLGTFRWVHSALYQEAATFLLKSSFSIRATTRRAYDIEEDLGSGVPLEEGEEGEGLPETPTPHDAAAHAEKTASAAIVSLAEGFTSNVVGPLFYYALFGVPGALAYRANTTLNALWGHNARHALLGRTTARLNTVINFVPARLGALFLAGAASIVEGTAEDSWAVAREENGKAPNPNVGWTAGATAGALDIRLDISSGDWINEGAPAPDAEDMARARRLFYVACAGAAGAALLMTGLRSLLNRR